MRSTNCRSSKLWSDSPTIELLELEQIESWCITIMIHTAESSWPLGLFTISTDWTCCVLPPANWDCNVQLIKICSSCLMLGVKGHCTKDLGPVILLLFDSVNWLRVDNDYCALVCIWLILWLQQCLILNLNVVLKYVAIKTSDEAN